MSSDEFELDSNDWSDNTGGSSSPSTSNGAGGPSAPPAHATSPPGTGAHSASFVLLPDTCICKTEEFDAAAAHFIVDVMQLDDLPAEHLQRTCERDGIAPAAFLARTKSAVARWAASGGKVAYRLGAKTRLNIAGRLCAVGGLGLQCFPRDVRGLLARNFYWDVDMKNAQPRILAQLCARKGWSCPVLTEYCGRRDELLADIMAGTGCSRDVAKAHCTGVIFGMGVAKAAAAGLPAFFTQQLVPELRRIRELAWSDSEYSSLRATCTRHRTQGRDPKASLLAFICQTIERDCLLSVERALGTRGRAMATYIHDGGLVRKVDGETQLPLELLRFCEACVLDETGYAIQLEVKPMDTCLIIRGATTDHYGLLKHRFEDEEGIGLVRSEGRFLRRTGTKFQRIALAQLDTVYRSWKFPIDGKDHSFVGAWLEDPDQQSWEAVEWRPSSVASPGCFNLFRGFAFESLIIDDSIPEADAADLEPLQFLVDNVTGGHAEYFWRCLARLLQRPTEKLGMCFLLAGESGIGKDTLLKWIGCDLLREGYVKIENATRDLFGNFNSKLEYAFFVHVEEASAAAFRDPAAFEQFKSMITSPNQTINAKNVEVREVPSYSTYFLSTNRDFAVRVEPDDRRFVIFQAKSHEHKADKAWFSDLIARISQPAVLKATARRLLDLDICGFDPLRERPVSRLLDAARRDSIPLHIAFLNHVVFRLHWQAGSSAVSATAPSFSVDADTTRGMVLRISSEALFQHFGDWQQQASGNGSKMSQKLLTASLKANRELEGCDGQPIQYSKLRFGPSTANGFIIRLDSLKAWLRDKHLVVDSADDFIGDAVIE